MLRSIPLALCLTVSTAIAQADDSADSLFARQDWAGAARAYAALVQADDSDLRSWFRLGYSLHALGRIEEALPAHRRAAAAASPLRTLATYNLACAQARLGSVSGALDSLRLAVDRGFTNAEQIESDGDLAALRTRPEFADIVARARAVADAARFRPLLPAEPGDPREFDFWLGEWAARSYAIQADNSWQEGLLRNMKVSSVCGGQAILEYATVDSTGVNHGFSIRSFDPERNQWTLILNWPSPDRPLFHAMQGRFHHGRGEFLSPLPPGQGSRSRFTFSDIAGDRLRWDGASSADGGRTWHTNLIFEFTRRDPDAPALGDPDGDDRRLARDPVFRQLDFMLGDWQGTRRIRHGGSWKTVRVSSTSRVVLAGTAIETRESIDGQEALQTFAICSYIPAENRWVRYGIDSSGPRFDRHTATVTGGSGIDWRGTPGPGSSGSDLRIALAHAGRRIRSEATTSTDGGRTWDTVWTQELERRRE